MKRVPPVLFELSNTDFVGVTLQDLPDQDISEVKVDGIGVGRLRLGGIASQMRNEVSESIADRLPSPVRVYVSASREKIPDLMVSGPLIVVSTALRETIGEGESMEYIPVEVESGLDISQNQLGGGDVVGGYFILNSWNRINIVNWADSVFGNKGNNSSKKFSGWSKLSLVDGVDLAPVYGLSGFLRNSRFVDPEIAHKIKKSNLNANIGIFPLDLSSRDLMISSVEMAENFLNS